MHSSILISKTRRRIAALLAVALCAWLISACFVIFVSPLAVEQRKVRDFKRDIAKTLDQKGRSKIVFVGGSSTTFGVMPVVLKEKYNIDAVNAGLTAGLGSGFLVLWGCTLVEPGDTLVVMVEPGLLRDPFFQPAGQTLAELDMPQEYWSLKQSLFYNNCWKARLKLASLKTSGAGLTDLLAKKVRHQKLSGNWIGKLDPYGTLTAKALPPGKLKPDGLARLDENLDESLTEDGAHLLKWVKEFCEKKNVRVCYKYPRLWVTPDAVDAYNRRAEMLSAEIGRYIPVLDGGHFATTQGDLFLDSVLHLNPAGARQFSEKIGRLLIDNDMVPAAQVKELHLAE